MSDAAALRRLLRLAAPERARLAAAALLGFLCIGSGVGLMATSAWLIARASQRPPILSLEVAIVAVRFFGISRGVLRYLERLATHDAAFRILGDLRVAVYRRLEPLAPGGLDSRHSGELLRGAVGDVDAVQQLFARVVTPPLVAVLVTLLAAGITALMLPEAALTLLATMAVAGVAVPLAVHRLALAGTERCAATQAELGAAVVEMIQCAPDLLAFGAAEERLDAIAGLDAELRRHRRRTALVAGLTGGAVTALGSVAVWLALAAGVPAVAAGRLDGVLLGVVALTALAAFEAVTAVPPAMTGLREGLGSARRLFELMDLPAPVVDPLEPLDLPSDAGVVSVRGLRVRYPGRATPALDGVDLELRRGTLVAVVGRSGAGKSTLAATLLRFRPYDGGEIAIGGVPVTALAQDAVRRHIGACGQESHLFATTVRENIRLARPEATQEQLRDAARRAGLLQWVESLPHGWDTLVGELGGQVSGGEARRIALARALLAGFPTLVLDEPTAGLDPATERLVMRDLLAATPDRAVLLITHRVAGLEGADEICVMDAGEIVERGTHEALVARGGAYLRLLEATAAPSAVTA